MSNYDRFQFSVAALFVAVLIALLISMPCRAIHREYGVLLVTDKAVSSSNSQQRYMVYGELDGGPRRAYIVEDSLWYPRWNSSDVWAGIEVGKSYSVMLAGYRVPVMSWWQNIITAEVTE